MLSEASFALHLILWPTWRDPARSTYPTVSALLPQGGCTAVDPDGLALLLHCHRQLSDASPREQSWAWASRFDHAALYVATESAGR